MSPSIPPHYTAFRVALVVTIVVAVLLGGWLLIDGQLFRMILMIGVS